MFLKRFREQIKRVWTAGCLILAAFASPMTTYAAPTVLDFEDLPAGTIVRTQYNNRGVLFNFAFLSNAALFSPNTVAHSGTRVLRVCNVQDCGEFNSGPMVINFTSPQRRVKMFAGAEVAPLVGTLRAFDVNGVQVGQVDGPKTVAADVFNTIFEVSTPTAQISRVELLYENSAFEAIDDLEFDGDPPPPPPATAPVVQITSPVNGSAIDSERVDLLGTVTGDGLLSPVFFTMEETRPPGNTAPPFRSAMELTGTGTTRNFAQPNFGILPLGPITFRVEAENAGGLKGSAAVTITNMPQAIQDRFNAEGGAAVFGAFRFGFFGNGCRFAVFENGAISLNANGATHLIRGAILNKILGPIPTKFNFNKCPKGEERDSALGNGARVQDFEGGRIYTKIPGFAPEDAFFIPSVFVAAIDEYGSELVFGVPLSDPTDSIGVNQTWMFQRYSRLDDAAAEPSTIEIRGTPPRLYIERQLGGWFRGSFAPSTRDFALGRRAATIWYDFPCDDLNGPCHITPDPDKALPPNNPNVGDLFCNGITYIPSLEGVSIPTPFGFVTIPPEWKDVRGQYTATPVYGAVIGAHMTDIDNGLTHETHNGTCPYLPDLATVVTDITCVSDFEYFVVPIGPHAPPTPLPSLFGKKNVDRIKTEYEVHYAAAAHNFLGAPAVGDLTHTTGRMIVDCGHDTYKTELHPIFSFAQMKTVISETNAFTGLEEDLFNGKPATRVAIWVNGWYPGGVGNEIEFDAFPPPRPSPDARLVVSKPVDFAAGGYRAAEDVTMEYSLLPAGNASRVHLRFSSPRRENTVTAAGEYMFEPGRQYWGIWYLHWE